MPAEFSFLDVAVPAGRAEPADPSRRVPRQLRLYQGLKEAILAGRLAAGARLPGTRQLALEYGMARNCVLFAYQQLQAEGFLVADRGGTRVGRLPSFPDPGAHLAPAAPLLSARARTLAQRASGNSFLPFAPGLPDVNAFPWRSWAGCLQRAWREVSARQAASSEPGGEPELRRAVAEFLSARRGVVCTPAQVFIFPGGRTALDACARLLADAGDTAWIEEPCYTAARNAMLAAGLKLVPVPVDKDGIAVPDGLWRRAPPRLIYVTPSHQYPLGSVLSLERRLQLLGHLGDACWLLEDDYDSDFQHVRPGASLPAMQGLRPEAPVIYIGTFSKLCYPGLRIAYMVVPRWAARELGEAVQALYQPGQAVEQRALARFIASGQLTRHVRRMAPIYAERQAVLRAELQAGFPGAAILGGQAGLHLTLRLPAGQADRGGAAAACQPADVALAAAALRHGVVARPLSAYYARPDEANDSAGLVLGYGMAEAARIPELVRRLTPA